MRTYLHITNGDGAAGLLKASGLEGDVLPWRDPMHHGPFPANADLQTLSEIRGRYLAGPGLPEGDVVRDFELRNEHLKSACLYEEVVLWFEHDLLDQLQILQVLDLVADRFAAPRALSMICIDRFEGVEGFRGLGQLTCEQIKSLWPQRKPVSEAQIALASKGWSAFLSNDPADLERFLSEDLGELPFLAAALKRHLEEYPEAGTGLTRTEAQILALVTGGVHSPVSLFVQNMDLETTLYMGNWPTFSRINVLCSGPTSLLRCDPDGKFRYPPNEQFPPTAFAAQCLLLTEAGKDVTSGKRSAHNLIARDEWLGGVHLKSGEPMWSWDSANQRLSRKEL
ncbi:MAG: hypothetical protein GY948_13165 [Alphaproteobacteria bacterium]|nr:hypothetical protein [Alphaproteobacteria bacterium]